MSLLTLYICYLLSLLQIVVYAAVTLMMLMTIIMAITLGGQKTYKTVDNGNGIEASVNLESSSNHQLSSVKAETDVEVPKAVESTASQPRAASHSNELDENRDAVHTSTGASTAATSALQQIASLDAALVFEVLQIVCQQGYISRRKMSLSREAHTFGMMNALFTVNVSSALPVDIAERLLNVAQIGSLQIDDTLNINGLRAYKLSPAVIPA
jgi:hypothetical protein